VQALGRAATLLEHLAEAGGGGLTLGELSRGAGLKPSTALSLLRTLQALDYVEQERGGGRYRLGGAPLRLAGQYLQGGGMLAAVEPALLALHAETGETTQLGRLREGEAEAGRGHESLWVRPSVHAVIASPPPRSAEPRLHCTALGKVLLAFAPPATLARLLEGMERRGLPAFGRATITSIPALQAELAAVSRKGYASNYEEGRPGVIGQAAPVRDYRGEVVAAAGVAYPAMRRTRAYDARMIGAVRRAAADASRHLGWKGPDSEAPR
jgi:DNA-binding IclR family transcriptional regulator